MKKSLAVLKYILSIHVFALFMLALIRTIFYLTNLSLLTGVDGKTKMFFHAMVKGLIFDNSMSCYVIILPLLVLLVLAIFNKIPKACIKIFNIYFIILYSLLIGLSIVDIPYFIYNQVHIGGSIFHWFAFGGQTAAMIFGEKAYYLYMALFIICIVVIALVISKFSRRFSLIHFEDIEKSKKIYAIPFSVIILAVCFVGIRGTIRKYPLRSSDAYFSSNSFFNQMGLNPAFFFIKSSSNYFKKYNSLDGLMDTKEAIHYVQEQFGIDCKDDSILISRQINPNGNPLDKNVVIVLMESFSSNYLEYKTGDHMLTPYIHSLINKSYYFNNFYSSGNHTNDGIASTHYGYPAFDKPMMTVDPTLYDGLPVNLKQQGYETLFFITGYASYDYMGSFLSENGFDKIYSQPDYPQEKVVNNFGVQDDYLFEFGIPKLNEVSESGKPFLATFLTVSNHPPYVIPDAFKNDQESDNMRMVAYVDNSLKVFMENASKEPWYDNTIFVFVGDHGAVIDSNPYEMPLTYNHVPLIIYSPTFENAPQKFEQFGGQIDVFPTVMGLLNRTYTNNTLGVDILKETRPSMFFVTDTHLACINDKFLYFYNTDSKKEGLYEYRDSNLDNLKDVYPAVKDSLKTYAVSMMITADYMVKNKLARLK